MKFLSNTALNLLNLGREELYGIAACRADHMVMVAAIHMMFEPGHAIAKLNLCRQATLDKNFERPIDGSVADGRFLSFDQVMQFFRSKVITGCKEDSQNCVTLRTSLEPKLRQMLVQNLLCGCDVIENARADIYSLLWYVSHAPLTSKGLYEDCRQMRGNGERSVLSVVSKPLLIRT